MEVVAYLWIVMASLSLTSGLTILFGSFCSLTFYTKYWAVLGLTFSCGALGILNSFVMLYLKVSCKHESPPLIGRFGRCAIDTLSVCIALIIGNLVKFDIFDDVLRRRILLISTTIYFHGMARLSYVAPDIGFVDMLLELFMQVMVFEARKEIYKSVAVLVFCGGVILFRCWSYSPPVKPVNESKQTEDGDIAC